MARMSPGQRRDAIVDAARRVLLRQGIAATTARDVAREMGTSSGLIHHYYASMDGLLAEAFESLATSDLEQTKAAVWSAHSPLDRLAMFLATYNRKDEEWAAQLWLDAWAEAPRRPDLQKTSRRVNQDWQRLLAELIEDGVAADVMSCADPGATAWRLISLLDGLALQTVAHRDLISAEQATAWAREYAEAELALPSQSLQPNPPLRSSAGAPSARG